jgi:hypothetical protein
MMKMGIILIFFSLAGFVVIIGQSLRNVTVYHT